MYVFPGEDCACERVFVFPKACAVSVINQSMLPLQLKFPPFSSQQYLLHAAHLQSGKTRDNTGFRILSCSCRPAACCWSSEVMCLSVGNAELWQRTDAFSFQFGVIISLKNNNNSTGRIPLGPAYHFLPDLTALLA